MAGFHPFEVTSVHIIYACLGGFIVLFGMFSLFLRSKLYISEACWAFLFGVIIGPFCADIFNPRAWSSDEVVTNTIVLEFTRVVLAIGVFAIGVELPKAYMARHWKSLFFLLVPVMAWGWLVSAAFIYALIPGLNYASSLAIAACLTPTDPILAAAVIGGKWADKHVPAHIRHLLAAESGCNDGAAFPFLFLALYILLDVEPRIVVKDWFLLLWFYQIFLSIVLGSLLGFAFRHLMKFCERHDLIDRHSYVAQYVSLAIFTIGVCTLLGTDDLLAAFACGTAFAWDGFFNRQTEESLFSSVIDLLFNVAAFIFVGAWMPFDQFQDAAIHLEVWRLVVIAILVLAFRRLPVMIAIYRWIPDVKNIREAVFTGHFGPMGIGAIFISTFALEVIHKAHTPPSHPNYGQIERVVETIHPIVGFMVLCSITAHGLSIPSFSLGRRVHSVSRTWSRHATATSAGGAPEWTHHARLVKRGDEIVINRDEAALPSDVQTPMDIEVDLERGTEDVAVTGTDSERTREGSGESVGKEAMRESDLEAGPPPKGMLSPSPPSGLQTPSPVYSPGRRSPVGHLEELPLTSEEGRRDWREPDVPDGGRMPRRGEGEEITEWKEGKQIVVERRQGPGDDVDVEVYDDPTQPRREHKHSLSLAKTASRELVGRVKDALTPSSGQSPGTGSPSAQASGSQPQARRMSMKKRRSSTGGARRIQIVAPLGSPRSLPTTTAVAAESAVDDEWESESEDTPHGSRSGHAAVSPSGHSGEGVIRSPSKSKKSSSGGSKVGHSIRKFVAGKTGRRSSTGAGGVPMVTVTPASGSGSGSRGVDEEERGRAREVEGRGSRGRSSERWRRGEPATPGGLQVESPRSRAHSPARSIRFMDERAGGGGES